MALARGTRRPGRLRLERHLPVTARLQRRRGGEWAQPIPRSRPVPAFSASRAPGGEATRCCGPPLGVARRRAACRTFGPAGCPRGTSDADDPAKRHLPSLETHRGTRIRVCALLLALLLCAVSHQAFARTQRRQTPGGFDAGQEGVGPPGGGSMSPAGKPASMTKQPAYARSCDGARPTAGHRPLPPFPGRC
jgi:hypothetical protein